MRLKGEFYQPEYLTPYNEGRIYLSFANSRLYNEGLRASAKGCFPLTYT